MPHDFWTNIVNSAHSADGGSGRVEPACKPPCIVEQRTNIFSYCGISCKNTTVTSKRHSELCCEMELKR